MNRKVIFITLFIIVILNASQAVAQTSFTHQGILSVPDGSYEFEFRLFDTPTAGTGTQQGSTIQKLSPNTVQVTGNAFAVQLDFGATVFNGADLYLETSWRVVGGAFTVLSPRERITAVYANRSLSAATADAATNATQLEGLAASGFIQNTTTEQPGTSFNIGGTGSANVFNATTQYDLNGARVLTASGSSNLFVGVGAGASNTTGFANSFFGGQAGYATTSGYRNSFFGNQAGLSNTTGIGNSFFGIRAGSSNTTASGNSFFGGRAGEGNVTGFSNAFFGEFSGYANNTGSHNAFFGSNAGGSNTTASGNTFIGAIAGFRNTTGASNTFVGRSSGTINTTGSRNTTVGDGASVATANLINATAIGANAEVSQSNSLVLGSINGVNWATADTFVGIGTTAPQQTLHVHGLEVLSTGSTSGFKFRNRGSASSSDDWVWYSMGNVARFWRAGVGDLLTITTTGVVALNAVGSAGGLLLCRNPLNQISHCSSSLRYKSNIAALDSGLQLINQLRPVTFDWKQSREHDLGLVAEEVGKVEPLLVTHNEKGEIEGVKYDRISMVLINAVKEQQQIIERQQRQIDALKKLVCASQPKAKVCK